MAKSTIEKTVTTKKRLRSDRAEISENGNSEKALHLDENPQKMKGNRHEEMKKRLKADGIEFILAQFVDIHGSAKVKMCPSEVIDMLIDDGAGFAGGAVWGMGQGAHSHDMMGRIDLDSYTPLPWQPNTVRFASDLYVDGKIHPFCPRANFKRILGIAKEKGFTFNVGIEPEHFLVKRNPDGTVEPWDPHNVDSLAKPCYDFKGIAPAIGYLQDITNYLNRLGWGVYQTDHEDANGQYEINFNYSEALTTADRYTFFKMMTSQIAAKYGAIATHMAKPFSDRTGNGAHIHYHLANVATGKNLFTDLGDKSGLGLSKLAHYFIGGVLKHAKALCAVISPTANCYKRILFGERLYSSRSGFTWTPAFITYGDNNRTQMIRVCGPGHVEDRTISAGCNPYLALAAYLSAGLDGIKNEIQPPKPNFGNMYALTIDEIRKRGVETLPQTLNEALDHLEKDSVILDALGSIKDEFVKLKRLEWNEYHRQVSNWEIQQYLTMF